MDDVSSIKTIFKLTNEQLQEDDMGLQNIKSVCKKVDCPVHYCGCYSLLTYGSTKVTNLGNRQHHWK